MEPSHAAADWAAREVAEVCDDPAGRLELLRRLYARSRGGRQVPYRRAALAFMEWQLHRGLLAPETSAHPGSPWWRAVNEGLLRDTAEAMALDAGRPGSPSTPGAASALAFVRTPSAAHWYRAHNTSIVSSYLEFEPLADKEDRVERFFINLALIRVMYAHALVAAPRLALGGFAPIAPPLGDPRLGMTAIFLSLSRVVPSRYPLGDDVDAFVDAEHGFGHLLDLGVIQPRLSQLYAWSAGELGIPEAAGLITDGVPSYAWDPTDAEHWDPPPSRLARWARRIIPAR